MTMFNRLPSLPTEFDLPYTDDQPVDNELQLLAPYLLRAILLLAWQDRFDWFMGVNLGVHYDPDQSAIGPDAFLSLGVPRFRDNGQLRLSYVVWGENNVVPLWTLEIVSKKPGKEYDEKMEIYQEMGVLYYVIFNPDYWRRDKHEPFEVYRLEQGRYVRQLSNPVWMPEIGLGIGMELGRYEGGEQRQWLYWYDEQGHRLPEPDQVLARERQRSEQERQRAEQAERGRGRAEQQIQELAEQLRTSKTSLILRLLNRRVGTLPEAIQTQVEALPLDRLEMLGEALLDFTGLADLENWLAQ
jgi:Uma2 family endonuclease